METHEMIMERKAREALRKIAAGACPECLSEDTTLAALAPQKYAAGGDAEMRVCLDCNALFTA